jgi:hypothetical protein
MIDGYRKITFHIINQPFYGIFPSEKKIAFGGWWLTVGGWRMTDDG